MDTPDFNGKSAINKVANKAGYLMTGISIADDLSNPNLTAEEKVQNTIQNLIASTPLVGPLLNQVMDNARTEDGILNLDNGRLSGDYSSGKDKAMNMVNARIKTIEAAAYKADTSRQGYLNRKAAHDSKYSKFTGIPNYDTYIRQQKK